ncbi:MAG: flagellar type III secretion system protein FliR [Proteobacteria bacterium]|nr:flagellar type III secretion system protein FliR [Pseudomonadota bacterium]
MAMLQRLLTAEVFALLLVFARVGSAMVLLPGIGENYVSPRVRILLAGAITIVVAPVVTPHLPPQPGSPWVLGLLLGGEIGIGLFIGSVARIMMATLETAGTLISFQIGLATASVFNPLISDQGSLTSVLISIAGMVLLFETDMHHLMLRGVVDSYTLFVPGALPPIGDFTEMISRTVSRSFAIALQIASPFLVVSLMLYVALGLVSRLMPQLQIFFVALPLQIVLGFLLLVVTFSSLLLWFLDHFAAVMRGFLAPVS